MIYFIQATGSGQIKIGFTDGHLGNRQEGLQTGSPWPLVLLGWLPGDQARERQLHRRFAHLRQSGEWFLPGAELVGFIAAHARLWPEDFCRLVEAEPALADLYEAARGFHQQGGPIFCATAAWYGSWGRPGLKDTLCRLVGWEAPKAALRTLAAYDVAYELIYAALPDCRGCGCVLEAATA